MRALTDSGPLIHLAAVNQFELLRRYFSALLVPQAVFQEVVTAGGRQPGSRETEAAVHHGWFTLVPRTDPTRMAPLLRQGFSPADASVLALAQEYPDHLLLTDDLPVRTAALARNLRVYGTLGLLIDGKRDGCLPRLNPLLDTLIASGFYLDPNGSLYRHVLELAGEG